MCTRAFKTHRFDDVCDGVTRNGRRREREIDDAKWKSQTSRRFATDEFTGTRQLKREFLDRLGEILQWQIAIGMTDCVMDHTRSGCTEVNYVFRFTEDVKCACHERIALDCIRETDKLRAREPAFFSSSFSSVLDYSADMAHDVHVDARSCSRGVDGRTQTFCIRECFRDRVEKPSF